MKISEILQLIGTFKKGVPFTLFDLNAKFANGGKIFYIGVMYGKIEPTWTYKAIAVLDKTYSQHLPSGSFAATPYFVFV